MLLICDCIIFCWCKNRILHIRWNSFNINLIVEILHFHPRQNIYIFLWNSEIAFPSSGMLPLHPRIILYLVCRLPLFFFLLELKLFSEWRCPGGGRRDLRDRIYQIYYCYSIIFLRNCIRSHHTARNRGIV